MSDDHTLATARFGVEVEAFLAGPIGKFVKEAADKQALDAMLALAEIEPGETEKIRALQNEIKVARSVMDWLSAAVQRGHVALRSLEAKETTD